jgi:hypothetical protein
MRKLRSIHTGLSCGGGGGGRGIIRAPSLLSYRVADELGAMLDAMLGSGEGMTGRLFRVALIGGDDELSGGGLLFSSFRAFARLNLIKGFIVQFEAVLVMDADPSNWRLTSEVEA